MLEFWQTEKKPLNDPEPLVKALSLKQKKNKKKEENPMNFK
jgi:hypothetical protein